MAKGGSTTQTQKVELPPEIREAALRNLGIASNVGALPYTPNFGLQMAAFSPQQEAGFANTNAAASAFGLPQAQGTGLPKPENVGGFKGYSTQNLYEDMMGKVNPQVKQLYEAFFTPQGREAMGADPIATLLGHGPGAPNKPAAQPAGTATRPSKPNNPFHSDVYWDWSENGGRGGYRKRFG